jgi:hypothetical protein
VKDRRLNSNGEIEEWERPRTIPDDFIYDPETNSYYAPGEPSTYDAEAEFREIKKFREECRGGVITVDELRAAGALDVPAAWRKSLGGEKSLFDESDAEAQAPVNGDQPVAEGEPDEPAD